VLWAVFFKARALELYEMIPGFIAGLFVTVAVSLATEPPAGAVEEFEDVHRSVRRTT
jgi:Na+/proline symporter